VRNNTSGNGQKLFMHGRDTPGYELKRKKQENKDEGGVRRQRMDTEKGREVQLVAEDGCQGRQKMHLIPRKRGGGRELSVMGSHGTASRKSGKWERDQEGRDCWGGRKKKKQPFYLRQ